VVWALSGLLEFPGTRVVEIDRDLADAAGGCLEPLLFWTVDDNFTNSTLKRT
jgi:hypothetical protein